MDLISANFGDATLTVLLNDGSGSFAFHQAPRVGSLPKSVRAADVNGDGKVDLMCANTGGNTLSVLTNNGGGTFGSNATLNVGFPPNAMAAADLNGDGKVDLISANTDDRLRVLTNNGSGGFALALSPAVGRLPNSIAAADVNGDGTLDLISANTSDDTLTVLFNTLTSASVTSQFTGGRVLVDPGSASLPGFAFVGDEDTGVFSPGADNVAISTVGIERLRVNSAGLTVGTGSTPIKKTLSILTDLDFPNTVAQASSDLTITLPGAESGDAVFLGVPSSSTVTGTAFWAFVSPADTVTVRFVNARSTAQNPAPGRFRVAIIQF